MDVYLFTAFSVRNSEENSIDPDQTPHFAASELGLHCLQNTPKLVFSLRIKITLLVLNNTFEVEVREINITKHKIATQNERQGTGKST